MSDMEPTKIQEWFNDNRQDSDLYFKKMSEDQVIFIRDSIGQLFGMDWDDNPPLVVSTHHSKSTTLPVVNVWNDGVAVILRGNYYNWIVSVEADQPVTDNFYDLIVRDHEVHDCYAEGFDKSWVFDSYAKNPSRFTVELPYGKHFLWSFLFLVTRSNRALS
jgi:hypothetical protein